MEKQDFLDAIDRIVGGLERKSKIITPEEKNTIAHHEAGHATVSWLLPNANPLLKVTIIPRGQSLGAAWYLPEERQLTTTEQMMDEMAATIGGTGLGQIAISYGHQRFNPDIKWICVFLTVLIVQLIQIVGTAIERKTDRRIK